MDLMLEQTAARIFADHRESPDGIWSALEENGLTRLWVSEAHGGFGTTPADGFGLARLAGANALPVPIADTLIATRLMSEAGLAPPSGRTSLFIEGWQRGVAFGDCADHVLRVRGGSLSLHLGPAGGRHAAVGEDPVSDAGGITGKIIAAAEMDHDIALPLAALTRAAQMCGALDAALTLTIGFAEQRKQFGKALSEFQAIQHLLSEMGAEVAAATAALDAAIAAVQTGAPFDLPSVAVAKFRAGLAAGIVCEHAHQIHGAIGYTQEYALARLSRRLWQWREDFGGDSYWAGELGRTALRDRSPLWPKLTAPSFRGV
jgi:acyl-CoA dehydrogenase